MTRSRDELLLKDGLSRARETSDGDAKVLEVVDLMTSGRWRTGPSHRELAAKHGVSESTVRNWAATASKLIRLSLDPEEVKARIAVMLERHESVAMNRIAYTMSGQPYEAPDVKAATGALKAMAEVLGLVEQKHKVDVSVQAYAKLDDGQMLEHCEAQIAKLTELRNRLLAKKTTAALPAVIDVEVEDEPIEG